MKKVAIIGAGAAGYFTAIQLKEKGFIGEIRLYEKSKTLAKVKISGGGRCNVTHACFEANELVENYPRGHKEMRGPFAKFLPGDMLEWLHQHQVEIKIEEDGRIFPASNQSQTIIDAFEKALSFHTYTHQSFEGNGLVMLGLQDFEWKNNEFIISLEDNSEWCCDFLVFATGSSEKIWKLLESKGVPVVNRHPSLFTFHVNDPALLELSGLVVQTELKLNGFNFQSEGPLLITHWGVSGPAVLKLSAWAAVFMAKHKYEVQLNVDSAINYNAEELMTQMQYHRIAQGKKDISSLAPVEVPNRWWRYIVAKSELFDTKWADVSNKDLLKLVHLMKSLELKVNGKSTFKEEFVVSGGVDWSNLKGASMESKTLNNLFFVGEMVNVDGVTGGFNFQAAWSTGFSCASAIIEKTM
jgi:predicted Rossmann fold flavoprotein